VDKISSPIEKKELMRTEDQRYWWSYGIEYGNPNERQKLTISGFEASILMAQTNMKKAKISIWTLAMATIKELEKPKPIQLPKTPIY